MFLVGDARNDSFDLNKIKIMAKSWFQNIQWQNIIIEVFQIYMYKLLFSWFNDTMPHRSLLRIIYYYAICRHIRNWFKWLTVHTLFSLLEISIFLISFSCKGKRKGLFHVLISIINANHVISKLWQTIRHSQETVIIDLKCSF